VVLVTHDHGVARHAGRIVSMQDGRVIDDAPVLSPTDARAAADGRSHTRQWAAIPTARWSDPTGRSHRWRNLYVADASVFPSSGGGEAPSLTIEALAIRTGRSIAESLRRAEI
jgi:hypothetical protein